MNVVFDTHCGRNTVNCDLHPNCRLIFSIYLISSERRRGSGRVKRSNNRSVGYCPEPSPTRTMTNDLDPLDPAIAKQMYLNERRYEVADATLQSHGYRLERFVEWCEQSDIDNLNELFGRDIHRFRVKRRNEDELATATMKGQLATLRMFLHFCASIDAVRSGLDEKIIGSFSLQTRSG